MVSTLSLKWPDEEADPPLRIFSVRFVSFAPLTIAARLLTLAARLLTLEADQNDESSQRNSQKRRIRPFGTKEIIALRAVENVAKSTRDKPSFLENLAWNLA